MLFPGTEWTYSPLQPGLYSCAPPGLLPFQGCVNTNRRTPGQQLRAERLCACPIDLGSIGKHWEVLGEIAFLRSNPPSDFFCKHAIRPHAEAAEKFPKSPKSSQTFPKFSSRHLFYRRHAAAQRWRQCGSKLSVFRRVSLKIK